jgi:hypothetical protein
VGHQIIKQPGKDTYAVFSSIVDSWILYDATREDLLEYYAERAAKDARDDASRTIDLVDENPRKAYCQFTLSFEEANAMSIEHGGDDLTKPEGEEEDGG